MSVAALKKKIKPEVKAEPANVFDLNAVLGTAVKEEKKSTSNVPVVAVDEDTRALALKVRNAKGEMKSATSKYESLEKDFTAKVLPFRDELCKKGYVSSINVMDTNNKPVMITFSSSFSKIPLENKEELEKIVGEDFENFFSQKMEISVNSEITEADLTVLIKSIALGAMLSQSGKLDEVIAEFGADTQQFARLFGVKRWLQPTGRFNENQFTLPSEVRDQLKSFINPYKPSLKV